MSGSLDIGTLSLVGGGNMGAALLAGLLDAGVSTESLVVVEVDPQKRESLRNQFGVRTSEAIVKTDGAVIAVKPQGAVDVCAQLAGAGVSRVLSIAAGVSLASLQAVAHRVAIVRAMPNTPALVREGASAISAGSTCSSADIEWARTVLSAVGTVVQVPEDQIDAVTAVAGSGPGYLFLIAECLVDAAIAEGLSASDADALVRQLFKGAGTLLASSSESPATLRERVTSPNGTTAAGLAVFETDGLRDLVGKAVRAAATRSRELGA